MNAGPWTVEESTHLAQLMSKCGATSSSRLKSNDPAWIDISVKMNRSRDECYYRWTTQPEIAEQIVTLPANETQDTRQIVAESLSLPFEPALPSKDNAAFSRNDDALIRLRVETMMSEQAKASAELCNALGRDKNELTARWQRHLIKTPAGAALNIAPRYKDWSSSERSSLARVVPLHCHEKPSASRGTKSVVDFAAIGVELNRDAADCRIEYYSRAEIPSPFTAQDDTRIVAHMAEW
eukprot:gene32768-40446_t